MQRLSDDFAGGSLNAVEPFGDDMIVKRYAGSIPRGAEKLINEYRWLTQVPNELLEQFPLIVPTAVRMDISGDGSAVALYLKRLDRKALGKSICRGEVSEEEAWVILRNALELLLKHLYRCRTDKMDSKTGFRRYHSDRIALARKYLSRLPYMVPLLNAAQIIVNGVECPSINQFLSWLDTNWNRVYRSVDLVAFHGNFHLDNILFENGQKDKLSGITFVDPRGDLVGYAHYDLAKLLITLEGYYDEFHLLDGYDISTKPRGKFFEIRIAPDRRADTVYAACLKELPAFLEQFVDQEGIDEQGMLMAVYATECIHILSFCFYHAYRRDTPTDRVRAFLSVFALMARRLFRFWDNGHAGALPTRRIFEGDNS